MGVERIAAGGGWRELLEVCSEGVAITDDGRFADVSNDFARLHGTDPESMKGVHWETLYTGPPGKDLEDDVLSPLEHGETWQGTVTTSLEDATALTETLVLRGLTDRRVAWAVRDVEPAEEPDSTPAHATTRPYRTLVESFPNGAVSLFDTNLRYTVVEGRVFDELDVSPDDMEGERLVDVHSEEFTENNYHHYEAALDGESREFKFEFGGRWYRGHTLPVRDDDGRVISGAAMTQDITPLHDREQALQRRRDELATLNQINELLLAVTKELVESNSREAVEQAVCERLADSGLYDLAWIGQAAPDGAGIAVRTDAGDPPDYLTAISDGDGILTARGPAGEALRTQSVTVASPGEAALEPWTEAAREAGFTGVAAVPLHHEGAVHGVLLVHTARKAGISERERAGLAVLGRMVGFVIEAIGRRKLLFTETVTELEFHVATPDSGLMRAASRLDCTLALDGYVAAEDRWTLYLAVTGTAPDDVAAALAEETGICQPRVLDDDETGGRVEVVVKEPPLLNAVDYGTASVTVAEADPDGLRLVLELPVNVDVRRVVSQVRTAYPGAELIAKRGRERGATVLGRPDGVLGELTDRQQEVLEAAYRAGYFEWPRESSAEEVAKALELSAATLHGHLRKAERTVLSDLFNDG